MFKFCSSLGINRPPADVWAALIDFPNVPKWERGPVEVRQVSPGPPGVGTRLVARRIFAGRESLLESVITEWDPGRSATMALTGGPLRGARATYAVEPDGDARSVVTYLGEGTLRMPLALLTPLMPVIGRAVARRNLQRLKRMLELAPPGMPA
jgi:carbon monoxide dehydrogenase subunit G